MKTPREILFARHRSAEPKLDALRQETVAAVCNRRSLEAKPSAVTDRRYNRIRFWRELILPRPRAWAGLAAVWVLILALKLSTHDPSHVVARDASVSPEVIARLRQQKQLTSVSPEVIAKLRQQKQLFAELAGIPQLP